MPGAACISSHWAFQPHDSQEGRQGWWYRVGEEDLQEGTGITETSEDAALCPVSHRVLGSTLWAEDKLQDESRQDNQHG